MPMVESQRARFGAPVAEKLAHYSMPEPNSGCWIWTGTLSPMGYGILSVRGVSRSAHRLAWELQRGPIPDGLVACHKCDMPCCINVDHLFIGTNADNTADMLAKGRYRHLFGEDAPMAKLTEQNVREIRNSRESSIVWARRLGVCSQTVLDARNRETWKHVQDVPMAAYGEN